MFSASLPRNQSVSSLQQASKKHVQGDFIRNACRCRQELMELNPANDYSCRRCGNDRWEPFTSRKTRCAYARKERSRSVTQGRRSIKSKLRNVSYARKIKSWRVRNSVNYLADLAAAVSIKPSMACFNCESTSSAMVITSSITVLKSTLPRLFCRVLKMLTCRIRDSSTTIGTV